MVHKDEITYLRGELSAEQLSKEIGDFWAELKVSSQLQTELAAAGFDLGALADVERSEAISVRVGSSGADPASVLLIIAFAPTANRVLKDLWATTLLPRIRRRWGDDAVRDEISRHD